MYVLCIDFKLDFSVIDVGFNLFEGFYYQVSVRFRNNALSAEHFGVSATGEGCFAVSKKDTFKQLEAISGKVKGWATGGNLRIGAYMNF